MNGDRYFIHENFVLITLHNNYVYFQNFNSGFYYQSDISSKIRLQGTKINEISVIQKPLIFTIISVIQI